MQGHEKVKDITMVLLECILSSGKMDSLSQKQASIKNSFEQNVHTSVMKCAADAFQILMSDSELRLNRKFHATIRPLLKQRYFSTMMPILQPLIIKSNSSFSRSTLFPELIANCPFVLYLSSTSLLYHVLIPRRTPSLPCFARRAICRAGQSSILGLIPASKCLGAFFSGLC